MASTAVVFDILARDRASDKFTKIGNSADHSQSKISKFGSVMKSAAKAGAIGLGIAAVGAGKALFEMGKAAAEDQASAAKLAQTLKNTTGATDDQIASVEDWISAQGRALGVTDDELRPALQRLAEATGDVGEAQKLTSLAMDVSAGTGKSLKTVSEALMKAQNGQISGLSRLGIETKNAAGETLTFEQATRKMADQFGGQAATKANTLQGKMDRLKLILAETGEEIGAKLIPIATKFATWMLNDGLPAAEKFGGWLRDNLGPIFSKIGDVWRKVTGSMSGDGNKSIGQLREVLGSLASTFRSVVSIAQSIWRHFGDTWLAMVKTNFGAAVQIIKGAFQIIAGVFKVISAVLKGDWSEAWEGIKEILKGALTVIKGAVKLGLSVLKALFKAGWIVIKGITKAAWDGIKQLPRLALAAIKGYFKASFAGWKVIFRAGWDAMKNVTKAAWEGVKGTVSGAVGKVLEVIRGVPGKIRDLGGKFKDAGGWVIQAFIRGLSNVGSLATSFASSIWNAVKGAINSGIDRLNDMLEFDFKVKGIGFHVNPPDIGHLARGTRNWRGGVAVVGEEGPELVNLPRGSRVTPNRESMGALRGVGGGGGGDVYHITINGAVDAVSTARQLERLLIRLNEATGRPLQVRTLGAK